MSATLYHHMYVRCQVLTELASNRTHLDCYFDGYRVLAALSLRGRQRAAQPSQPVKNES